MLFNIIAVIFLYDDPFCSKLSVTTCGGRRQSLIRGLGKIAQGGSTYDARSSYGEWLGLEYSCYPTSASRFRA